jgi:glycosyltransferase A (GT-A) superfamily protein (DUF2064 family)
MPFSANFVKITLLDGKLLVEGLSDPDDVNRIDSMQIAIDTVSHAGGNGNGDHMQAVSVDAFDGSGDWVVEVEYDNGSAPAVGTSMLVAGATVLTPPQGSQEATDSPFFWFQTLPVEA